MYIQNMTLAEWMEGERISDAALATRIGKSRVSISRYRRKLEIPGSETVKDIVRESLGRVTANELLGIQEAAE